MRTCTASAPLRFQLPVTLPALSPCSDPARASHWRTRPATQPSTAANRGSGNPPQAVGHGNSEAQRRTITSRSFSSASSICFMCRHVVSHLDESRSLNFSSSLCSRAALSSSAAMIADHRAICDTLTDTVMHDGAVKHGDSTVAVTPRKPSTPRTTRQTHTHTHLCTCELRGALQIHCGSQHGHRP